MADCLSKIEEIKARWAAATPGPWSCESDWSNIYSLSDGHLGHFVAAVILRQSKSTKVAEPTSDAQAIAAAPDDIRWLVERVERLQAVADAAMRWRGVQVMTSGTWRGHELPLVDALGKLEDEEARHE